MRIEFQRLPLRPYPGEILLFRDLSHLKAKYYALTKTAYPYEDEATGGRFVHVEGNKAHNSLYLVYGRKPHVLAHEFGHILLLLFKRIGSDPAEGGGEPFCYMLSQLMLDAI